MLTFLGEEDTETLAIAISLHFVDVAAKVLRYVKATRL